MLVASFACLIVLCLFVGWLLGLFACWFVRLFVCWCVGCFVDFVVAWLFVQCL